VSISGQATISEDLALKKQLFGALNRGWFPGGADDPDLELVQITIQHAEYWNVKEGKTAQLLKLARAAVSGHPPEIGEHREMRVTGTEAVPHE
jgi:general stress protein 26